MSSEELQNSRIYKQGNTTVFRFFFFLEERTIVSLCYKKEKTYETEQHEAIESQK